MRSDEICNLGIKATPRECSHQRPSLRSIPRIFVGGELIGGASEVFAAFAEGRLQALFEKHGVSFEDTVGDQLYSLKPGWLQARKSP